VKQIALRSYRGNSFPTEVDNRYELVEACIIYKDIYSSVLWRKAAANILLSLAKNYTNTIIIIIIIDDDEDNNNNNNNNNNKVIILLLIIIFYPDEPVTTYQNIDQP
jgi:hypothetical protein